ARDPAVAWMERSDIRDRPSRISLRSMRATSSIMCRIGRLSRGRKQPMRRMILVGFLQAQNCTNIASSWRHPASRTDSWSPEFYRHIGRVLEEGKFHLGFFDDRLSMP